VTTAGVATSPHSYKAHGALALALFEADPGHANLDRVIAEAEKGLAILEGLPDERLNSDAFLQAADYYRAKGAYQRELELLLHTRSIVEANRGSTAAKFVEVEDELSAAYLRLGDAAQCAAAATAAIGRSPQTAESYRLLAAASLMNGKAEDAAIALFEGLFATRDMDLRSKLETLYQNVLGGQGCALLAGPNGPQINPSCEIVRRHACSAVARLIPVYARLQRQDLAIQMQRNSEAAFGCQ
jgi:tetratricopeptide (TPR) repeat protein